MAKYRPISAGDRKLIVKLEKQLGSKTLRTLLSPEAMGEQKPERTRIVSNRRLGNLSSGKGKLTAEESAQLARINRNAADINRLKAKGHKKGQKDYQTNRALRTWVQHGKQKGGEKTPEQLRAIRALRFLGVDVDSGKYYVKRK